MQGPAVEMVEIPAPVTLQSGALRQLGVRLPVARAPGRADRRDGERSGAADGSSAEQSGSAQIGNECLDLDRIGRHLR